MAFPTTALLDNFNRADESPIAGNWGTPFETNQSSAQARVVSNQYGPVGTSFGEGYWNPSTYADCECWATFAVAGGDPMICLRLTPGTTSTATGYAVRFTPGTPGSVLAYKLPGYTALARAGTAATIAVGDQVGASMIGSTITAYVNGVAVATWTDASYASGNLGLGFWTRNSTARLEDFGGGSPVTALQRRLALLGVG
jgi:hypothetical protein